MTDEVCACCGKTPETGSVRLHNRKDIVICWWCLDGLNGQRDRQRSAGLIRVASVEPIFGVSDVARAVDHYERLGFAGSYHDDTYAFAAWGDDLTIHLTHNDDPDKAMVGAVYLHVDDASGLADQWRKAGMDVKGPEDFDYGAREGSHADPDGNLIRFGSPLPR